MRVPVADGHLLAIHARLTGGPTTAEVTDTLRRWTGKCPPLPSCPRPPLQLTDRRDRPSTRLDVDRGSGMAITIGRIEPCPVLGIKLFAISIVVHVAIVVSAIVIGVGSVIKRVVIN